MSTLALDIIAAKGRTSDYDDLRAQPLSSAPPEIELFHKRAALRREMETAADETTRRSLQRQLSEVEQMIALRLEAMRVSGRI